MLLWRGESAAGLHHRVSPASGRRQQPSPHMVAPGSDVNRGGGDGWAFAGPAATRERLTFWSCPVPVTGDLTRLKREIEALRELVSRPRTSAAALTPSERMALRGEVDRFIQSLDEIRDRLKS